jgi:hypothetical protein
MADSDDMEDFLAADERHEFESHPLIRLLTARQSKSDFGVARVVILRPRAALGFEPARLTLEFLDKQGNPVDYKTEEWDPGLNGALIRRKIMALDEANEVTRFGLALAAAFEEAESRYGDGFFNSVLMVVIDKSPFASKAAIKELRTHISTNRPYQGGHSADDCAVMIQSALQDRWFELRKSLGYQKEAADRIMAGALASYLDERFTVTDRRKLGWLTTR